MSFQRAPVFPRERSRADRGPAQAPRQRRHPYCRRAAQIPAPARVPPFCPHRPGAGKRPRPRRPTSRMLRARSHGREHRFLSRMTSQGQSALPPDRSLSMRQGASRSSTCRPWEVPGPRSKSTIQRHDPASMAAVQPAIAVEFRLPPLQTLVLAGWGISQDEIAWKVVLGRGGRCHSWVDGCGLVLELIRRLDQPRVDEVRPPPLAAPGRSSLGENIVPEIGWPTRKAAQSIFLPAPTAVTFLLPYSRSSRVENDPTMVTILSISPVGPPFQLARD